MWQFGQGESYVLPVILKDMDLQLLDIEAIASAEFTFGTVRKLYPGDVDYDGEKGVFQVPLSQEDTFQFRNGAVECQARVKLQGGAVLDTGIRLYGLQCALSKVVL